MRRLFHLGVGGRLWLGFAVVILLMIFIAVLADLRLTAAAHSMQDLVENRVVKKDQMAEVKENLNLQARAMRNILLTRNVAIKEVEHDRILNARLLIDEIAAQLIPTIHSEQGRERVQAIQAVKAEYLEQADEIIELGMQNVNGTAANRLMSDEFRGLQGRYFAALDSLAYWQDERMQEESAQLIAVAVQTRMLLLGSTLIAVLLSIAIAYLLARSIIRQLGAEPQQAAAVVREIAQGNLQVDIALRKNDNYSLMAHMRRMQESLTGIVSQVRHDSEQVAAASVQIADASTDLASRTTEQAAALQETAASMQQLGTTVEQNTDNAQQANRLAGRAAQITRQAGTLVSGVVETMRDINEASERVGEIISVIDGIAFQTNILALNAAVEAARAGEQGRGFAVVATEVRALAQRSASAAAEIQQLIVNSLERVQAGNQEVQDAGATMGEVINSIEQLSELMNEIAAAGREQNTGVAQVGVAVTQMDDATQQNAQLVEQMSAAAANLSEQAARLVEEMQVFKLRVEVDKRMVESGALLPE